MTQSIPPNRLGAEASGDPSGPGSQASPQAPSGLGHPVSIPIAPPLLVSTSSVAGHLACWAVRQSPYAAPDNMREAMEQFTAAFPSDPEMSFSEFHLKRWADFEALYDGIWAAIEASPEIVAWNTPKSEHGNQIGFVSRYDRASPDDDFIDLHALCRNVARAAWREAEDEAEQDAAWDAQGLATSAAANQSNAHDPT